MEVELDLEALKNKILSYKPGKAVSCDNERVVFPDQLVIGIDSDDIKDKCVAADILDALYGKEKPVKLRRADESQTPTESENQKEWWITDSISLIARRPERPKTETSIAEVTEGDLAEKVGCMVKIVNTVRVYKEPRYVEEIKNIKKITGRFPVCAILHNNYTTVFNQAIYALEESGMNYHCVVPYGSGGDNSPWLYLLHKCLQEGDTVLAANDLKKICKNPRCESLYEKTKKDLEEANQEKRSLQQQMKELEQKFQEFLASREGNDKALDKAMNEALENWKRTTKLQLERE